MITAYRGEIRATTDEAEALADLACIVKFIYTRLTKEGDSPVTAVLKIIKYVLIGFTYKIVE